jgi:hypothetical protein
VLESLEVVSDVDNINGVIPLDFLFDKLSSIHVGSLLTKMGDLKIRAYPMPLTT